MIKTFLIAMMCLAVVPLFASSYYPARLDDARAVYLTHDKFPVTGDGVADDSAALQQAIDKVQESTNQGILFVPSGRYRVTKTIYIWPGIRLIGFGPTRPVLVLGTATPGFQQGPAYMVFFAGGRPDAGAIPPDASPGTFYSAISNIDFEISDGNPGAVAVRAHYAQHCFLAHIDFRIGSGTCGNSRRRQRCARRSFLWRTVRHLDAEAVSGLAVHGDRCNVRGPARSGNPRARSRAYADSPAIQECPDRDLHRSEVFRRTLDQRWTHGKCYRPRRDHQQREQCPDRDQHGKRGVPQRRCICVLPRERESALPVRRKLYEVKTFSHGLHYADIGAYACDSGRL